MREQCLLISRTNEQIKTLKLPKWRTRPYMRGEAISLTVTRECAAVLFPNSQEILEICEHALDQMGLFCLGANPLSDGQWA